MDLQSFLNSDAGSELVVTLSDVLRRADKEDRPISLPLLLDRLLEEESVTSGLPVTVVQRARAEMAKQIAASNSGTKDRGRFVFDLAILVPGALRQAKALGGAKVTPVAFLTACLTPGLLKDPFSIRAVEALRGAGLTQDVLLRAVASGTSNGGRRNFQYQGLGFGEDLTAKAALWSSCPLIGMDKQLITLAKAVSVGSESVALIGEPGVGKSSLVYGLAYHLSRRTRPLIPPEFDRCTIVSISQVDLLAGTGARGELEERVGKMLEHLCSNRTVLAFFDEFHSLLNSDDPSSRIIATALKPRMASGEFRCIGATTDREYARYIAKDQPLDSRFTKVLVVEPDEETTVKIALGSINSIVSERASEIGLQLPETSVRHAVRLTARYRRGDQQPRKTIRLLRRVAADVLYSLEVGEPGRSATVTPEDVGRALSDMTGIPVSRLQTDAGASLRELEQQLNNSVLGQPEAIRGVVSWLSMHERGWVDPKRPRGRFVFLGPSGVGKSELAMRLAELIMQDRNSIVTKKMGEYKGDGARTRFMGADPGYIGYGETSTIYSKVMMRPYAVVVLDQIEKANPELADPLLSVLDGGAEDGQGRWVDFSQCIFILTSNAIDTPPDSQSDRELRHQLLAQGGIWTSDLLDRIDTIAVFSPLTDEILRRIIGQRIEMLSRSAESPLPVELHDVGVRNEIIARSKAVGGALSARALERCMLDWLNEHSKGSQNA